MNDLDKKIFYNKHENKDEMFQKLLLFMTAIDHYLQPCEVVSLQNCKYL